MSQIHDSEEIISREFRRDTGKVWISLDRTYQPGQTISFKIYYSGRPLIAVKPPWQGGFTWATTEDGSPWIATSCQGEGSDIRWPSKYHVSDEPDSMHIHVRVPDPVICATNGRQTRFASTEDFVTISDNIFITTNTGSVYTFVKDDTGKTTELIMQRESSDQPFRGSRIE